MFERLNEQHELQNIGITQDVRIINKIKYLSFIIHFRISVDVFIIS